MVNLYCTQIDCLEWFLKIIREMHIQYKNFITALLLFGDWEMYFYIVYNQSFLYLIILNPESFISLSMSNFVVFFLNKPTLLFTPL